MNKFFKVRKYAIISYISLMIVWIILTSSFNIEDIIIGLIVSKICLDLSRRYFYKKVIPWGNFHIHFFIKYIIVFFHQVWSSGLKAMVNILTFKTRVKIYRITTKLDNDFMIFILANTISLTPGTITIYREGNTLHVLSLFEYKDARIASKIIKQPFEKMLMGVEIS